MLFAEEATMEPIMGWQAVREVVAATDLHDPYTVAELAAAAINFLLLILIAGPWFPG